ncbi:hypothetical protein GCM10012275_06860 [Longimycelium tulufanense]|uniref:DUF4439 domain-containing protein n=1 Tax=Longimycelium tulufanense TaxID=907463 RepID=A0A8J3FTY3_9PSEU|nr:ferritin-like domain-containing protein [Longimycelium tulufanense]GGM38526.1 hypothetical protein GCM10012275_06860 [Longimycelium tulufanense]
MRSSTTPEPSNARVNADAVEAVQRALAVEHAAEWSYGVASAFVSNGKGLVGEGMDAHRSVRNSTEQMLRDSGATPVPPQPAYRVPKPVTDAASAAALLVIAESDAAAAWRAVLEHSDDPDLRRFAVEALTSAAVLATRWRVVSGQVPHTVAFPGQSG